MDKKDLQPKQKSPVVRPTTINPPQLSEELLTGGMSGGERGVERLSAATPCEHQFGGCYWCSFDGDDAD